MASSREIAERIARARSMLIGAERIVVLTGSGISAESGIPTFRGTGGLWAGFRVEDFATPEGFDRDPVAVWNWYADRRADLERARPNPGHLALAEIQRRAQRRGASFVLATQNIDGLHQAAGSEGVLELHGSMRTVRCERCEYRRELTIDHVEAVPACPDCGGRLRPDVVWFGEPLPVDVYAAAVDAASSADLFLSVGTSALIYPAAGLIEWALSGGAKAIEVNLEPTPATRLAAVALHGKAGEILPMLVGGGEDE
jgi:NAD-dependent deacetylase